MASTLASAAALDQAADGFVAGRFEILRLVGDGSFAVVYEARDCELDRQVALKLFTSYAHDELEAALREARAMARLHHDNVLIVHDIGEHQGAPFLALEYAETDLRRWLNEAERDPADILARFCAAGRGLAAAHDAGLVHHDFKPANVLIRADGSVAVGDFGLARRIDAAPSVGDGPSDAARSYAFGTLRYIAPERLLGEVGDARADQFSFCVALWEALAGHHPFAGSTAERRYASIAEGPTGPRPRAPRHVLQSLRRGLALDPERRFASMKALLEALEGQRRPQALLRRGLSSLASAALLVGVFSLGFGLSREAPALDVTPTPAEVLTAQAAIEEARELTVAGEVLEAEQILDDAMPLIHDAPRIHQRDLVVDMREAAELFEDVDANAQAGATFAKAEAIARWTQSDDEESTRRRNQAQAEMRRQLPLLCDKFPGYCEQ